MANGTNAFDFSVKLQDFLAQAIDDGTYADIINALKIDKAGFIAPATGITVASGQLWSNVVDDFMQRVYGLNPGRKDYTLATVGALTSNVVLATLTADGQLYRIKGEATGRTGTDAEVASVKFSGHFYRDSGVVNVIDPIHTIVETAPLAGIDLDLDIDSDDVRLLATGIGGKNVGWAIRVELVEEIL